MHAKLRQFALPAVLAASVALAPAALAQSHPHRAVDHGRIEGFAKGKISAREHLVAIAPGLLGLFGRFGDHAKTKMKVKIEDHVMAVPMANVKLGTITAISPTSVTVNGTTYTLASNATIRYRMFLLTTGQVPPNTEAALVLNSAGDVASIWLQADANLPPAPIVHGQITTVTTDTITIDGYTLPVASNVMVDNQGQSEALSQVPVNSTATVRLNREGIVEAIWIGGPGPNRNILTVSGTVSGSSATSITIGANTYTYAPGARIRYREYGNLSPLAISVGSDVVARLNSAGQVTEVRVLSDTGLPARREVSGTVSAVNGSTITVDGYTLTLAPSFDIAFLGATSLSNSVTTGEEAHARLNASGQVSRLVIGTPANNGNNGH